MKLQTFFPGTVILSALIAAAVPVRAQEGAVLVVTGAKVAEDQSEAVEAVEVIDAEAIAGMGARTVADVLENIPGVVLFQRAQSTAMMQGFDGAYVKILVDGMKIAGDEGGGTPVSLIPVAGIDRIEIVRGASSVLYGSDAMGGVINIITKKPERDRFSFSARQQFSSNKRYYGEGFAGLDLGSFSFSLGGGFDWDDGRIDHRRNNMGRQIDFYDVSSFRLGNVRGGLLWRHPLGELEAYGNWSDSLRVSSSTLQQGYAYDNQKLEGGLKYSFNLSAAALIDGFFSYSRHKLSADEENYDYGAETLYIDNLFRDLEGEIRFSWEPHISHSLLMGFNAGRDALASLDLTREESVLMLALFVQDTWNVRALDKFRIVPGLRFDLRMPRDSSEDPVYQLTPKLSLRYDPFEKLVLRLSYGMGFKIPSLKENYWVFSHPAPNDWLIRGNPNLKPETSQGFNLQADYAAAAHFSLAAAAYFNYVKDKIETLTTNAAGGNFDGKTYTRFMEYGNVGKAYTAGGDLSLSYRNGRFGANVVYNIGVARGYNEDAGEYRDLSTMTPHQANLGLSFLVPAIETNLALQGFWHAPRRLSDTSSDKTPDYLMGTLRVSKLLWENRVELFGEIENLFNNFHFIPGTGGSTQEDYYRLKDGMIVTLGGTFRW
jgi:outer membrane receptor for ferrienterochelin and colicins